MITTIQIRDNVKNELDKLKEKNQSYEEVILNLMRLAEKCKRNQEELLIEGCKIMAKDMIEINKEWEAADSDIDWEWNDNKNGNKKR
jgi:predicted CopG family antitoxin